MHERICVVGRPVEWKDYQLNGVLQSTHLNNKKARRTVHFGFCKREIKSIRVSFQLSQKPSQNICIRRADPRLELRQIPEANVCDIRHDIGNVAF
jgi:hypothetical protein